MNSKRLLLVVLCSLSLQGCSLVKTNFERNIQNYYDQAVECGFGGSIEDWKTVLTFKMAGTKGKIKTCEVSTVEIDSETKQSTFTFLMTNGKTFELKYDYKVEAPAPDNPDGPVIEKDSWNVADYYGGYYRSISTWTNGEDLVNKLHALISANGYNALAYGDPNWETNQYADQDIYDREMLDVIYSDKKVAKTATDVGWQREHAYCASLMTGSTTGNAVKHLGRSTDFHNLFAGESSANMSRGNKNYGVASTTSATYANRFTSKGEDGYAFDEKNFEPGNKDKGRVARALFYMTVMYNESVQDVKNNVNMKPLKVVDEYVNYIAGDNCLFAIGNGKTLYEWALKDVDMLEMQHNSSVYSHLYKSKAQGNRNPFVDYPELIKYVYGDKKNEPGDLSKIQPAFDKLGLDKASEYYYSIQTAKRQYDEGATFSKDDIKLLKVTNTGVETLTTNFTVEGVNEGETLSKGKKNITIKTDKNEITYEINVETDKISKASYSHNFTLSELKNLGEGEVTETTLSMGGINWKVSSSNFKAVSTNANLGVQLGTSTAGISTLTLKTSSSVNISGKITIKGIYLRGSASSGKSYAVTVKVGTTTVGNGQLGYIDKATPSDIIISDPSKATGVITITISGISSAIYLKSIGIDVA